MSTGRSALPVFGLWVAWVYILSLIVLRPAGDVPLAPPRPEVRFVDADETFQYELDAGPNGLRTVHAELSETFDRPIEIPVTAIPVESVPEGMEPARPGVDYAADRDAVLVFPANSRRGVLRERDSLLDVAVTPDAGAAARRRFRLRLDGTEDVVVAPDPQGFRTVEIPASTGPRTAGIRARFQDPSAVVAEKDLVSHAFVVETDQPAPEKAEMLFSLYRRGGSGSVPVVHFTGTFPAGARAQSIRLGELLSEENLRRIGAAYDPRPGFDEWYELHLDARPPLISASDPCFTTIFSRDTDDPAALAFRFENASGEPIRRIVPQQPFWVVAELSKPIEVDCPVTPTVNGTPLTPGGLIPAGTRRSDRLGPYVLGSDPAPGDDELSVGVLPLSAAARGPCSICGDKAGGCATCRAGACKSCKGSPGGCPECRGRCQVCNGAPGGCSVCKTGCSACGGIPGGCPQCRAACTKCGGKPGGCEQCRGKCPRCDGRPGGCAACGNGAGKCDKCGGKPGQCSVCGGSGRGGSGGGGAGSGGDGSGAGGGGAGGGGSGAGGGGSSVGGGGSGGGGSGGGGGGAGGGGSGGGGGGSGGGGAGGGGDSPVSPPPSSSLPKGPAVPGDFMIFLVNNQRLHEPGDVITDQVRKAIKDRKPYAQGAIVINDEGKESVLDEQSVPPAAERAFEPFSADQQDLEGQAARVVDTIVRKRRNAENPDIRTLVVWPEREFVSAKTLDVFKSLANDGRGPISFLCPDADPERARELAAALRADSGAGEITVRSPKSEELVEHIDDVLDVIGAKPTDRLNVEESAK